MLSGCTQFKKGIDFMVHDTDPWIYEYAGYTYEWRMSTDEWSVTLDIAKTDTAIRRGWWEWEIEVRVYDDPQLRFIYDAERKFLFHRADDPLPDYKDIRQIERIALAFSGTNVVLQEGADMVEMVRLLSQPWDKKEFRKNNSPKRSRIATIVVYFKDYPAYHRVGSVIQAEDGSYGIIISAFTYPSSSNGFYDTSDYIPIPPDSPLLLYLR